MNSAHMIFKYWAKSKKKFILEFIFLAISTIFNTIIPIFIGRMIGLLDPNLTNFNIILFLIYFFFILICGIATYLFNRVARVQAAEVSSRALYYLRDDVSNAIYRQSFSYFDKTETGQLISRATSDIEETRQIFGMGVVLGFQSSLQISGIIIGFFIFSFELSIFLVLTISISLVLSYYIAKKLKPIFLETRNSFGDLTSTIREDIVGAQVVRIFSMQNKEYQKFKENNNRFYKASVNSIKYNSLHIPSIYLIIGIMTILLLFIGGIGFINGTMKLDTIVTLLSYIASLGFPLMMMGQLMLIYIQADAALIRVRDILDSSPEIKDFPNALPISNLKGDIDFENVSFGYTPDHRILKSVTFKVPSGKKLAILGTTGSGKSTIINLIPRFYEVNEGTIKIDQKDIKNYLLADLRENIGIVSQETFLFNKSIASNIAYGNEKASREDIIEAAKIADLHDFIVSLPKGYDTIVGERGTRLSGGQKQRLSIARALLAHPKILILDDSTSSVDVETEYRIQQALAKIMKNITSIIITQRISTIRGVDYILILDRGHVVGYGTHDELIESNVLYKQIYETLYQKQISKSRIG